MRQRGGAVFRLDPRDLRMEVVNRGWVNAWGHQFDAFGQSFMTDGAGNDGIHWGLPGASYLAAVPSRRLLDSVSPGKYPKFAGIEFVRSPLFPAAWQGNVITGDFRAHRVVRFAIEDQGAGYITRELPDVLRSVDSSFRPIDVAMGPDGALYIADWSNPIIQHGEVDFRDPRRDKEHGRIWRVAPKGAAPLPRESLPGLETAALLDRLNSPAAYTQGFRPARAHRAGRGRRRAGLAELAPTAHRRRLRLAGAVAGAGARPAARSSCWTACCAHPLRRSAPPPSAPVPTAGL
jgi:hypothetical protein